MYKDTEKNSSIECSIYSCQNHCESVEYCGLSKIKVGTHEQHPTVTECTDCESFVKR